MDATLRKQISDLIHREVVLATGCTEPGAVALCVAKACETLGTKPERVDLYLSKNVFKNAMGVGIPGTGMIGLPIAVAMAVTHGDSSRKLEVLMLGKEQVEDAKKWLANNSDRIHISVKDTVDKLYIEAVCTAGKETSKAIISKTHTCFTRIEKGGEVLVEDSGSTAVPNTAAATVAKDELVLNAQTVFDYATTTPIEELEFIREAVKFNEAASQEGLKGYGLHAGAILNSNAAGDIVHTVVAHTVAASDARMDGCTLPIYSNSGSGNQGIACTLPVYKYGQLKQCSEEQITRALILSSLMSIYVKKGIGRLSALCGIVNASIGVTSAIVYLHGGDFQKVCYAIKNLINTIAGMLCDGAKPSCALKMATGMYSAFVSAELAYNDYVVDATDGLSQSDIDLSIRNLARLGHDGMNQTDDMILDIMMHKEL